MAKAKGQFYFPKTKSRRYYIREIYRRSDNKPLKSGFSRYFKTFDEAAKEALRRQQSGRICQAEIYDAKNMFAHELAGEVNLSGKVIKEAK